MSKRTRPRKSSNRDDSEEGVNMLNSSSNPPGFSNQRSNPLQSRTPKSFRNSVLGQDQDGSEIILLNGQDDAEHQSFHAHDGSHAKKPISMKDKKGMVLLWSPRLALGSIPFILRSHLSYSQLGVFALSGYPYSLKLFWSPIVDSIYFSRLGRRKSWIIPMQFIIGSLMLWIARHSEELMDSPNEHVPLLTIIFTLLVFLAATQDIAVDGWALTLLSPENLSYASTCQTFGLNTGYFASFTVFLALNSEDFAHSPPTESEDEMNLQKVYGVLWSVCKLKRELISLRICESVDITIATDVQSLCIMHFICKIGFQANEAVTQLKMVEKGLKKEDMALSVLIDFPFQLLEGYLAARWARGDKPLRPWIWAFWGRLGFAVIAMFTIAFFPKPPISTSFFIFIILTTIGSGFTSTVQFVGISAFHTRVADPLIGGTYMTLLNTATNLGGTWPRYFVLRGVDMFSVATCRVKDSVDLVFEASECVSEHGKQACESIGGMCITEKDGYYFVSIICVVLGLVSLVFYIIPTARRLQAVPPSKWKVNQIW
ncbi:hypothetical protein Clacol_008213 [Clathrus columnatus]|uniref:Acetyl-coenzyme A transporter 1 n=1 Tax=Clathrus columnatus TaxID=1419009 RepID=A0AAV5ANG4_9AGAM|nr:hypothetical protein Clacol_008213 [Clathrus columnatus]